MTDIYRGRFAPSPTGPLHFGSLIAATGSYLQARCRGGQWLIRIDDIDPPREVAGASDQILRTLEAFGFEWDESVVYQSQRDEYYYAALAQLADSGLSYPCACSRKEIASAEQLPGIYPGTCRSGLPTGKQARQVRIRVDEQKVNFDDGLQGPQHFDLATQCGDFVIHRADGYVAYQLATALDDVLQGITEVVRGYDLLDSTPRQIFLQQRLGYESPAYCHLPVAINADGQKLSKQNLATGLDLSKPGPQLIQTLLFLGQAVPQELARANPATIWEWAKENWQPGRVPAKSAILATISDV